MQSTERSISLWKDTAALPSHPPLTEDLSAEVCVIGAGIAGVTTAYLLAREGRRVVVVDRLGVGAGETGQTSAHLASDIDDFFHVLEHMHGRRGARLARESHQAAIERIASIVAEEQIDCDFSRTDGYLFAADESHHDVLRDELESARAAGFTGAELLPRIPLDFWDSGPCIRYPAQGQFHPLRYLGGLAESAMRRGVRFFGGSEVVEPPTGGSPVRVRLAGGLTITAASAVVATNYPITDWLGIVPKLAPYRTYIVGLRVPAGSVPRFLYWDTCEPYHYVRVASGPEDGSEVLIVGGEDHKTGQEDDPTRRFASLEAWTRQRFPMAGDLLYRWSGQVQEPADAMGYIGAHPGEENLYVVTGDSGQGLTHGTLGAILVSDLIVGRDNEWSSLYDPSRSGMAAPLEMARENLNAFAQYRDRLLRDEIAEESELRPGSGAVMRIGGEPIAVYRDVTGTIHRSSAICTHLGCVIRWNSQESSWDCPCHGSRFSPHGQVLTGPAIRPLEPRTDD